MKLKIKSLFFVFMLVLIILTTSVTFAEDMESDTTTQQSIEPKITQTSDNTDVVTSKLKKEKQTTNTKVVETKIDTTSKSLEKTESIENNKKEVKTIKNKTTTNTKENTIKNTNPTQNTIKSLKSKNILSDTSEEEKIETELSINEYYENIIITENKTINGTLKETSGKVIPNADINIVVNNENKGSVKTNNNGKYSYTFTPQELDTYTVTAQYNGNQTYFSTEATTEFDVEMLGTTIVLNDIESCNPNTRINITGSLTTWFPNKPGYNLPVTIKINNQIYNTTKTNKDGIFIATITSPAECGKYTVIADYAGDIKHESSSDQTELYVKTSTKITINNPITLKINDTTTINGTVQDIKGNNLNVTLKLVIDNNTYTIKTTNGKYSYKYTAKENKKINVSAIFEGDDYYAPSTAKTTIDIKTFDTIVKVNSVNGVIGEKITLVAYVTDSANNKITGGNLVFKLNGLSLRENGTFDSKSNLTELKLPVINGTVTYTFDEEYTIKNVALLKNIKNITASYSGFNDYKKNTSNTATVNITLRTANINIKTSTKLVKQNSQITLTAIITDTTKNTKTNYLQSTKIIFKINGKTMKDENGDPIIANIKNNTATINYTIPRGTNAANETANPKNYTVTAIYGNKIIKVENNTIKIKSEIYNYTQQSAVFNVEKSPVTINITNANINTKTNTLSIKASMKDYQGNLIVGTSKIAIKINGLTLKDANNQTRFFNIINGAINLNDVKIQQTNKYLNVTIVSGERYAYEKTEGVYFFTTKTIATRDTTT